MIPAIETRALRKVYPLAGGRRLPSLTPTGRAGESSRRDEASSREVVALRGLDLQVGAGEFFGLLGPNGAGKTTTIGILTTRIRATSGSAVVAGADVASDAVAVRQRIGVVPQRPNPDRSLNVAENLIFHAAYFGLPLAEATHRSRMLLEQFGIADKAAARVEELSGGQQQRLMIARALIHEPEVIFLDEPTVGLDPQARRDLWIILRGVRAQGRTIVITTHYMEEADQLCDRVAIIDEGRLLAVDTPSALKAKAPGGTLIEMTLDGDTTAAAKRALTIPGVSRAHAFGQELHAYSERGGELIPALIRAAEESGHRVHNINLFSPSLETLFISLTGKRLD